MTYDLNTGQIVLLYWSAGASLRTPIVTCFRACRGYWTIDIFRDITPDAISARSSSTLLSRLACGQAAIFLPEARDSLAALGKLVAGCGPTVALLQRISAN